METRAPKHSKRSTYPSFIYSNVPGRFYLFHEAGTNNCRAGVCEQPPAAFGGSPPLQGGDSSLSVFMGF